MNGTIYIKYILYIYSNIIIVLYAIIIVCSVIML